MPVSTRVDAHHHLWQVSRGDYHWMPDGGPLREDYLADRLLTEIDLCGIDGTILVQAAQTVDETRFLLDLARDVEPVLGVVGWVDLEQRDAWDTLGELSRLGPLVAVRPMLPDLDDPRWICRPAVIEALQSLHALGQRFELLSQPRHLPAAYEALEAAPDLPVVIDHLSKPTYEPARDSEWRAWMQRFAQRPGTYCKLSGMVTEPRHPWTTELFRPYAEFIFEVFGTDHVMFGSDWPVCRQAAEYRTVVDLATTVVDELDPRAQEAFWHENAESFYGVAVPT